MSYSTELESRQVVQHAGFAKSSAMKHTPLVCAALKRGANVTATPISSGRSAVILLPLRIAIQPFSSCRTGLSQAFPKAWGKL
ncbi:hypothetical protein HBH56_041050 [Parastagonospora nodorum]|nr:hypothetical protein HBH56_041050 [Parastagonospora nodorum]KAH3933248.1 hypothetical protein HBH54_068800 [Parastagonospora nodorum]KAH3943500.1 hypothetical protein HBH53_172970 [Parastagonospora nodorum]KAH3980591.1 hypothetical protein HBH51_046800 [Parastagonospora nodorum]KAH4004219.1 hypothetical protein HBI10_047880 [Parastagonospora nodorum]